MALPEPDPKPAGPVQAVGAAERVHHLLIKLDNLVMALVNNPIFEQGRVIAAQMSKKARADLEEIIEVSDRIKRGGEKQKDPARKSQ